MRGAGFNKDMDSKRGFKQWVTRLGFWGGLFFVIKGLLWLTIPALIALFAD